MHKTHVFPFAFLLLLCRFQHVVAQPPVRVPAPKKVVPRTGTPEQLLTQDVARFIEGLNSNEDFMEGSYFEAMHSIQGARPGYLGGNEWHHWWLQERGKKRLKVDDIHNIKIGADKTEITITCRFGEAQQVEGPFSLKFDFRPLDDQKAGSKFWQFVPQTPAKEESLFRSPVRWAIWMMAQSPTSLNSFRVDLARQNLKLLGLGAVQLSMDFDDQFAFLSEFQEEALKPYLKDSTTWIVPGTKEKFLFNKRLALRKTGEIANPTRTILFYDGADEKPVFRFEGKTAVCLADGHMEFATTERFNAFSWD